MLHWMCYSQEEWYLRKKWNIQAHLMLQETEHKISIIVLVNNTLCCSLLLFPFSILRCEDQTSCKGIQMLDVKFFPLEIYWFFMCSRTQNVHFSHVQEYFYHIFRNPECPLHMYKNPECSGFLHVQESSIPLLGAAIWLKINLIRPTDHYHPWSSLLLGICGIPQCFCLF
jgi:hypothetical protein